MSDEYHKRATPAEEALATFDGGLFCAESVLSALAQRMGEEISPAIATGLCSGMARNGGTCGAVSGAILALGIGLGRNHPGASVEPCYTAVNELMGRFRDRFGSTGCADLLGCRLDSDEGQQRFEREALYERCRDYVRSATEIADDLLSRAVPSAHLINEEIP